MNSQQQESDALCVALQRRDPLPDLLYHSDQGRQYARRDYQQREKACAAIFDHIEIWYNRRHHQSARGYLSPDAFERQRHCENIRTH